MNTAGKLFSYVLTICYLLFFTVIKSSAIISIFSNRLHIEEKLLFTYDYDKERQKIMQNIRTKNENCRNTQVRGM